MRMSRGITRSRANGNGMSATDGIAGMPSPGEIAADRSAIPIHHGSPPVEQVQPSVSAATELGPVSPELALIDPELARAARERLPDPPRPVPLAEQPVRVEPRRSSLEPVPVLEPAPPRRRVRLALLASAAGVIALGVLLALVVGREGQPARDAQQTQSVSAALSPPKATITEPERTTPTPVKPAKPAGTSTTPTTSAPSHATAVPGQTFVWVAAPDAAAYEFQLFQGGERVYRARVQEARLELPGRWRQDGRPHALFPGSYRWYVWMISKRTKQQSAKPTVSAKLVVAKQAR